jgi:hypothetical protein
MVDPLALSLSGGIQKIGSYAGLVAFIALALLSLLYFAQARELKRLSQWAARQPDPARQPAPAPVPAPANARPATAPAGSPSLGAPPAAVMAPRPTGAAVLATNVPGVRRVPTPVPGASAGAVIGPTTPAGVRAQAAEAASSETAGTSTVTGEESVVSPPASADQSKTPEGGATKVQAPAAAPPGAAPAPTTAGEKPVAPATVGGATQPPSGEDSGVAGATPAAASEDPAPTGATPAAGGDDPPADPKPRAAAVPLIATPVPERVAHTGIVEDVAAIATTGEPAAPAAVPAPGPAAGKAPAPMLPPAPHKDSPVIGAPPRAEHEGALAASYERLRRLGAHGHLPTAQAGRRRLIALIAVGVIAIVVVAVVVLPGGGSSPHPAVAVGGQAVIGATAPTTLAVAVLNGTDVGGLASKVSKQLTDDGFTAGTIANAPNQTTATTTVGYTRGHQAEAIRVARALDLGESSAVRVSAANEAAARVGGRATQIVVTIGANYTQ